MKLPELLDLIEEKFSKELRDEFEFESVNGGFTLENLDVTMSSCFIWGDSKKGMGFWLDISMQISSYLYGSEIEEDYRKAY